VWNPHNVISGPKPETRGDDPDCKKPQPKKGEPIRVDKPLLNVQPPEYKASVDNFINVTKQGNPTQSLEAFGNISKPTSATYAAQKVFVFFLAIVYFSFGK